MTTRKNRLLVNYRSKKLRSAHPTLCWGNPAADRYRISIMRSKGLSKLNDGFVFLILVSKRKPSRVSCDAAIKGTQFVAHRTHSRPRRFQQQSQLAGIGFLGARRLSTARKIQTTINSGKSTSSKTGSTYSTSTIAKSPNPCSVLTN